MVVLREPGEVFLLRHGTGDDAVSWVERIDPESLEAELRSPDLPGGPTWPGGVAAHANGSLYVVFGRHAHRLGPDLRPVASARLPRDRPYNSFVVLADGHLVTKDFGGVLPGHAAAPREAPPAELVVLEPERLRVVASLELPEPSLARLSSDGDAIYVVGSTAVHRARWDGTSVHLDGGWRPAYRTAAGQGVGWDPVLGAGAAWFLDDGEGSERYSGTLVGHGVATDPLHLVRADLGTGAVTLTEICGRPGGLIANPPLLDPSRGIAVGYDSGNAVLAAFDLSADGTATPRWRRDQAHGCHLLLFPDTGELVSTDHDAAAMVDRIVVLDIDSGREIVRVDSPSPVQSVLFGAPGWDRDLYLCSFTTLTRVRSGVG